MLLIEHYLRTTRNHFSGTDFNVASNKKAIYKIIGEDKDWSRSVDMELGNYDYLMFADVDYSQTEVREDIKNWGVWISTELSLKGFRVDAIRHVRNSKRMATSIFLHLHSSPNLS